MSVIQVNMVSSFTVCYMPLPSETQQNFIPQNLTRDNTQLLFNSLFSLPSTVVEKVKCVQLPAPTTKLPREKPIPKPKTLTKWEAFAKSKGLFN